MCKSFVRRARRAPAVPFLVWFLFVFAFGAAGCDSATDLPYSALKARIAAGEVQQVRVSATRIEATPTGEARQAGAPALWTSVPIAGDADFVPLLDAHGVVYQGIDQTARPPLVLGVVSVGLAVALGLVLVRRGNAVRGLPGVAWLSRSRARDVAARVDTRFDDVAGIDEAKEELEEVVQFLRDPSRFAAVGARVPRGVLLVGPAGTGKTLLARAVAGEAGVPFFAASGSDFIEMYVGVGASRVRRLFARARAHAPAIVFIDEIDAVGKARTASTPGSNDEREHTLNQLLVELDGFDRGDAVVVIAATNRADTLDPALLRPGRFDRQVVVDRPDASGREAILRVHARQVRLDEGVDLDAVARRTAGFAGADLANLLNEAALLAVRRGSAGVGMVDLEAAVDRVVAGLERKHRRPSEKERRIVAYHEAGHAIVAELAPTAEAVRRVSIVPRGSGALGFMQQMTEDRYLLQQDELVDRLAVLLGGRAAEGLVFQQFSTGASNDLERASELARRMVCEFGMSSAVGPVSYGSADSRSRRAEGGEASRWSDENAARIESEVQALLAHAFDRASRDLQRQRHVLDALAAALLERGSLDRDALLELMQQVA